MDIDVFNFDIDKDKNGIIEELTNNY